MSKSRSTAELRTIASNLIDPHWIIALRLCASVTALLAVTIFAVYSHEDSELPISRLYVLIAGLFSINAISALWIHRKKSRDLLYLYYSLLDIPVTTGVIYLTGDSASPFVFLYLLLVIVSALLLSRRASLTIALLNAISYGTLIYLTTTKTIPSADGIVHGDENAANQILQIIGLASGMVLVAVGTNFLRARILITQRLIEDSIITFESISSEQKKILDELSDGLIVLDRDGMILSANLSAHKLFCKELKTHSNYANDDLIGQNFSELLLLQCNEQFSLAEWIELGNLGVEFSRNREAPLQVDITCKPVRDTIGIITGCALYLSDVTLLRDTQERLNRQERMVRLLAEQQTSSPDITGDNRIVGDSVIMRKVFDLISRVSRSDTTVLISGESGTGKELVARSIHFSGPRSKAPFVAINCGAIPEALIESELFGHQRGSFTGAHADTLGLFRQAEGGTLFLDEVGELPLAMQAKLLRAIQERSVRPVGATIDIPINVRIVAATNRNLKSEVEKNTFREDLFYRLNVIGIPLPPLRKRKEDLPVLISSILTRICKGAPAPALSPQANQLLTSYGYPGNIRELENILERAVVLGGSAILPEHLPENLHPGNGTCSSRSHENETEIFEVPSLQLPVALDEILAALEKQYIERALVLTNGAKKEAANLLGINFRSFRYRLSKSSSQNQ